MAGITGETLSVFGSSRSLCMGLFLEFRGSPPPHRLSPKTFRAFRHRRDCASRSGWGQPFWLFGKTARWGQGVGPFLVSALRYSEELVDLAAEGFDAGIRLSQFIAADMVAVRLTKPFRFIIVGSPAYLTRSRRPERPADLRQHACL